MTYAVIYFSRTGTSRRIAEKIAKELSVEPVEVTDNMDWDGTLGYMRAARYAMKNKDVDIQIRGTIGEVDEYIIVSPMWCGKITPVIRIFLQELPKEKVRLIVSSGGMIYKRTGWISVRSRHHEERQKRRSADRRIRQRSEKTLIKSPFFYHGSSIRIAITSIRMKNMRRSQTSGTRYEILTANKTIGIAVMTRIAHIRTSM